MSFEKELDFVVFGATGFTGKLVVEYINSQYSFNEIKWAMAGRNLEKLAQVKDDLNIDDSVELIEVDSNNLDSINRLTQKTKCILTTVGPYQLYGNDIVKSCAESGTDYVDLCGEPGWMHKMINEYSTKASETGARIVFSCGFDSIPFDLGVLFLQNEVKNQIGKTASKVFWHGIHHDFHANKESFDEEFLKVPGVVESFLIYEIESFKSKKEIKKARKNGEFIDEAIETEMNPFEDNYHDYFDFKDGTFRMFNK